MNRGRNSLVSSILARSFLAIALLVFSAIPVTLSAQLEGTGIVPTDPGINRINWARSVHGSSISGGTSTGMPLGALIDGVGTTFSAGYSTLVISAGESHIVDLGQARDIHKLQIRLYDGDNRFFRYRIEASLDGVLYDTVVDRTTGEHRGIQSIDIEPVHAQYFKITGTHSSLNNAFHLIDQIFLIGDQTTTPHSTQTVTIDAKLHGGSGITDGVERQLHAGVYLIEYLSGASSRWASDSANGGRTWDTDLRISVPQNLKYYLFGFVHDKLDRFATPAQAEQARQGESFYIYLPVEAPVFFQYTDTNPTDNRGSQTYRIVQVSGPNDSLLVRVRDAITRSISWQEREVARWENWITTSNRNCFGCHTQTQASVGLNETRQRLTGIPISDKLESELVDAYQTWQHSSGFVSPFHGSNHRRTQTSLWAWAVSTYMGESFDQLRPNLLNAAQWLRGQQAGNGGWNPDHTGGSANPLYADGSPSAAHTTGNMQAFMRLISELSEGEFVPFSSATFGGGEVELAENEANVHEVMVAPVPEVTGIRITINDSFDLTEGSFVLNEFSAFDQFQLREVSSTEASFEGAGFPISESHDGVKGEFTNGWSTTPEDVRITPAQALWRFAAPVRVDRIQLTQIVPSKQLNRYTVEFTDEADPTLDSSFTPFTIVDVGEFQEDHGTTVGQLITSVKSAANLYYGSGWNYGRNTRTTAQTIIGLSRSLPLLTGAEASAAFSRIIEAADLLRTAQRTDGGWSDATGGGGTSHPFQTAQVLYSLLQVLDQEIDQELLNGVEYLLNRQLADGSWIAPAGLSSRLSSTTWVEIALPLIFDALSNQFSRETVVDLRAIGLTNGVELSWSPFEGATGYNIYRRSVDGAFRRIATNHQDTRVLYFDSDVQVETTYIYMVRWLSSSGAESSDSNDASATPSGLVCGGDSPPVILSAPVTEALEGNLYRYQVDAYDPDEGDVLTYSIEAAPVGMSIDSSTGLIQWIPALSQIGSHFVRVWVHDQIGRFATQGFRVTVSKIFVNLPPAFYTTPITSATAGYEYRYSSRARDPNVGDILTYSLEQGPAGMTINSTTGFVRWPAPPGTVGDYPVTLRVEDAGGLSDEQSFVVSLAANQPPQITSVAPLIAPRRTTYLYQVEATDPEGGQLQYHLLAHPAGMSIQRFTGRVLWTPGLEVEGTFPVHIRVTDPGGLFADQPYQLVVPANDPPYFASIPLEDAFAQSPYSYQAVAVDPEEGDLTYAVVTGPTGLNINSTTGLVSWQPGTGDVGPHPVVLKATDDFGLFATQSYNLEVHPAGSGGGPGGGGFPGLEVTVHAPEPGSSIKEPTEVVATIDTTTGPPDSWEAELKSVSSGFIIPIGSGTGQVLNSPIGLIDPTVLANDSYLLYIRVVKGSLQGTLWFPYDIASDLKLGEFSMTVSDLTIPLSGLSLDISRRYTTINRSKGEFGAGWHLQVPGRVVDSASENPLMPFTGTTRVFVTRPDGKRVGFTFAPYPLSPLLPFWMPYFAPDPGVTDTLEVSPTTLFNSGGQFFELFGPFNPSTYYLTTRERVRYKIDENQGLLEARDANFNTLTFTASAIHHSSGESLQIQRDGAGRITKITDPSGKDIVYQYDGNGDLLSVTNQAGETTTYTYWEPHLLRTITLHSGQKILENFYSPDGRLIKQVDGEGNEINIGVNVAEGTETIQDARGGITILRYDENGNLIQRTEPDGAVWSYTYDSNFNQTSVTDPLGKTSSATYDSRSNMTSVTDKLGRVTQYAYNSLNLVTSVTNALGATATLEYDSFGNVTSISDFAGRSRAFSYDSAGQLITLTDGLGQNIEVQYDSSGRPTTIINALGHTVELVYDENGNLLSRKQLRAAGDILTRYEYDELGRVIKVIDGEGYEAITVWNEWNKPLSFTGKRGFETTFEYDSNGNLLKIIRPDGTHEEFEYDGTFNLISERDALGRITTHEFDSNGRRVKTIHPDLSFREYEYNSIGRLVRELNENGHPTLYTYDDNGRLLSTTDALGRAFSSTYNELGHVVSTIDQRGQLAQYEHDAAGKILKTIYPDATFETWEYDQNGRKIAHVDPSGYSTQRVYDSAGRLIQEIDELGHTVTYQYDEVGNLTRITDQAGASTTYQHNRIGQAIREINPLGAVQEFSWDGNNNRLSVLDFNGRLTSYHYDELDRVIQVLDPLGAVTQIDYDAVGNRTSLTDALGNVTEFQYDARNREIQMTDPLGRVLGKSYDGVGNLASVTSRRGLTREFDYNAVNQLVAERWLDGPTVVNTRSYTLSESGQILSESDNVSAYSYQYDPLDRLVRIDNLGTLGVPHTVLTKEYDALGNITSTVDNTGFAVQSVYDPRSLLASRIFQSPSSEARVDLSYLNTGKKSEISRFKDTLGTLEAFHTEKDYDLAHRPTAYVHNRFGTPLAEGEYTYNAGGELVTESHFGENTEYGYSPRGELTSAQYDSFPHENFSYDLAGNPIGAGIVIGPGNQIIADSEFDYSYDEEGNLTEKLHRTSGEREFFEYDHLNSLIRYEKEDSSAVTLKEVEFTYDVRGRRIAKTVDGISSYYLYDQAHVWADFDNLETRQASYIYADRIDELFGVEKSGEGLSFYMTDRLGSVRGRADASGNMLHQKAYRAFGGIAAESGPAERYAFTGREYDPELGLYYYRARYYDPRLGRFISQDPLGFSAGDANLYRYIGNSPVNGRDPSGMISVEYGSSAGPAATLAASKVSTTASKQIIVLQALEKAAVSNSAAAATIARLPLEYVKYTAADTGGKLAVTQSLRVIFGLSAAVFLDGSSEQAEVVYHSDGTVTTTETFEFEDGLTVEREERKRKCDPNNRMPLTLRRQKMEQHSDPTCLPKNACFYSFGEGRLATLITLGAGDSVVINGDPHHKRLCFPYAVGYDKRPWKEKSPLFCVIAHINANCEYRGYPEFGSDSSERAPNLPGDWTRYGAN